ncbi:hypothetical protein LHT11_05575 [Acetobacter indonesiensis]|nr:hypothetical protein [Acetobacter indonesiensis]MCG0994670.1 hypothetical protein [Acetobacter indonesiensis]
MPRPIERLIGSVYGQGNTGVQRDSLTTHRPNGPPHKAPRMKTATRFQGG